MWRCWLLAIGCGSEAVPDPSAPYDVLVEAAPGTVVLYRDGYESHWQLAPAFGGGFGFDVTGDPYAVTLVDVANRRVETLFTTLTERSDIHWSTPSPFEMRSHVISGSVTGLDELQGGLVASAIEAKELRDAEPFSVRAPEGTATLAFGRFGEVAGHIASLAVRRDIPVIADLELDLDLAEALPTNVAQVLVPSSACEQHNTFSFGDTTIVLGTNRELVALPHPAQWLPSDHLTIHLRCDDGVTFQTSKTEAWSTARLPTRLEFPLRFVGWQVYFGDERFTTVFDFSTVPVEFYEVQMFPDACGGACPRWTSRITEGWIGLSGPQAEVFSPSELDQLGLLDPALELPSEPTDIRFEMTAVTRNAESSTASGVRGVVLPR